MGTICPKCGSNDTVMEYGGERGEAGPFVRCANCDYDEEELGRGFDKLVKQVRHSGQYSSLAQRAGDELVNLHKENLELMSALGTANDALRKIASCESRTPGDVVDIARKGLEEQGLDWRTA